MSSNIDESLLASGIVPPGMTKEGRDAFRRQTLFNRVKSGLSDSFNELSNWGIEKYKRAKSVAVNTGGIIGEWCQAIHDGKLFDFSAKEFGRMFDFVGWFEGMAAEMAGNHPEYG
ncbi:MAG: hypothetical protein OEY94_08080 [Alphaproteobacteria bacterium]|nr:hypothetical protein [Alphaproteobacteria bacterium]